MKEDTYCEAFERFEKRGEQPSWVYPVRKAGLARFAELGFPTVKHEDWRFTNVSPIARMPFRPVLELEASATAGEVLKTMPFAGLDAIRLVFVDGHWSPELSSLGEIPAGATIGSLAVALRNQTPAVQHHLTRYAVSDNNAFTALNTAFFADGAFIQVSRGHELERPVHLVYIASNPESGATSTPRNLILAEQGSRLTVIESYLSAGKTAGLTNAVTELIAGDNSTVEHVKVQDECASAFHIAAIHAVLGRSSNTILHSFALGARLSRNSIRTVLAGEGLDCVLNGLYLTKGDQLADHHMVVEHAQPHCNSHEYYNGILDGRSKGVFHGRILVRQIAQKTDAKQTNKNLLLSDEATVDTKPQLEIYADDVKCTHGATIGQLNDESIFYLRARGIGAETARRMLIHAFAGEITERIRYSPVREELDRLVWDRLEANPLVAERPPVTRN